MSSLASPEFAIPEEQRVYITWHLPICRDCNELCFTPSCTREMYDGWHARHAGHTVAPGPEWPPRGAGVNE